MAGKATSQADIDERYREQGWTKVQMGETIIYEKALPEKVMADIKEIDQQRKETPLWRRVLQKFVP